MQKAQEVFNAEARRKENSGSVSKMMDRGSRSGTIQNRNFTRLEHEKAGIFFKHTEKLLVLFCSLLKCFFPYSGKYRTEKLFNMIKECSWFLCSSQVL